MTGPAIDDGGLAVRGSEVISVGSWHELTTEHFGAVKEDLGEVIIMPGLINAHCHLDYTMMRGALFGDGAFSAWIQRLNAMRRSLDQSDYLDSIALGLSELQKWGCTTVLNIESFPELFPFLPESRIRVWWFLEVMDVRSRLNSAEALAGAIHFFEKAGESRGGFGISPHAPYTVSRDLYELSALYADKYRIPLCTHLAESMEETEMFVRGEGPLYEFLRSIGRQMDDCRGLTPIQMLLGAPLLPKGSILVHMNHLGAGDRELLKALAGHYHVVHCPRTHAFFHREPFELRFFQESRIPLLLGTDSLASNEDLNMFAEMRAMSDAFPELDPAELMLMATKNPAAAIGRAGRLGELSPGTIADFIAVRDQGGVGSPCERALANTLPPQVWISGHHEEV
jgi:cytosine/adenosine deaminase-related metal-dependent hydrolase